MVGPVIHFVGGGNMASAILGGLLRAGTARDSLRVIEPLPEARERLRQELGLVARAEADAALAEAQVVVWAVKPQSFAEAARPCAVHVAGALQLSVMAGVRCDRLQQATGSALVVRAMPNTPALIGQGVAGLYARPEVSAQQRGWVEQILAPTGRLLWVQQEHLLDAVTALSGSGPAYVFAFIETMMQAGVEMGLTAEQARELAQQTFAGAAQLAMRSPESPATLRERVTSKGGTTHAALSAMQADGVPQAFARALHAAHKRAEELGRES
jgi:pyrroline-5-carboxylate reductase